MKPWEVLDRQFARLKWLLEEGYLTDKGYEASHYDLCRAIPFLNGGTMDPEPKPAECDDPDCRGASFGMHIGHGRSSLIQRFEVFDNGGDLLILQPALVGGHDRLVTLADFGHRLEDRLPDVVVVDLGRGSVGEGVGLTVDPLEGGTNLGGAVDAMTGQAAVPADQFGARLDRRHPFQQVGGDDCCEDDNGGCCD